MLQPSTHLSVSHIHERLGRVVSATFQSHPGESRLKYRPQDWAQSVNVHEASI